MTEISNLLADGKGAGVKASNRKKGWDRQAVNGIAKSQYGGLAEMFEAHDWARDGKTVGQVAPSRVKETYGNVEGFVRAHSNGRDANAILDPWAAIDSDPPNVWLKSFYGFDPDEWGFIGFTNKSMRQSFLNRSAPGALIVCCATGSAEPDMRGKVVGIMQVSHRIGHARDFMTPKAWRIKDEDPDQTGNWNFAVQAIRAWKVTRESWMAVEAFAPETYTSGRARVIGSQGMILKPAEARGIRALDLFPFPVASKPWFEPGLPGPAASILSPTRAGPVSKAPFMTREAEGPKHLYILHLKGSADAFLGRSAGGRMIVKVGMSCSPDTRCLTHNSALPAGAFKWSVHRTTDSHGGQPFSSSDPALAGEKVMKDFLAAAGESLGGEFFLADAAALDAAWTRGVDAAGQWKK